MSRHVILVFLHSTPSVRFGVLCRLRLYDFLVLAMPYVHAWNLGVSCGVCASVMLRIGAALTIGPQRSEFSQTRKVEGVRPHPGVIPVIPRDYGRAYSI